MLAQSIERHPDAVIVHWLGKPKPWDFADKQHLAKALRGPGSVLKKMMGCGNQWRNYDRMDLMAGIAEEHITELATSLAKECQSVKTQSAADRLIRSAIAQWDKHALAFYTRRPRHGWINERRRICAACPRFGPTECTVVAGGNYPGIVTELEAKCPYDGNRWMVRFQKPDEHFIPASNRCVVTVAVGNLNEEILKVTSGAMRDYAAKCGADFVALTNRTQGWGWLEKFRVGQVVAQYEQTLFLDADVVVMPTADNLFALYRNATVALHDDYPHLKAYAWLGEERQGVYEACGIVGDFERRTCWNTGVVLTRREAAAIWSPPDKSFRPSHCAEQLIVEHNAIPFSPDMLPLEYNTQWWMRDFKELAKKAHFIHLANCPGSERVQMARKYVRQ